MSLLKADMDIANLYVELASDQEMAKKIFPRIREEYESTGSIVLTSQRAYSSVGS